KDHLRDFIRARGLVDSAVELYQVEELHLLVSHFFDRAIYHVVRMTDDWERPVDPDHAPRPARTGFADAFPLLLVSEASLVELNRRLGAAGKAPVTMDRFRPNVVIDGAEPFGEDGWRTLAVGDVTLDLANPCARCATTAVDQATGEVKDPTEPLATLATFRRQGNEVRFGR